MMVMMLMIPLHSFVCSVNNCHSLCEQVALSDHSSELKGRVSYIVFHDAVEFILTWIEFYYSCNNLFIVLKGAK
jgi:hypothetical protein